MNLADAIRKAANKGVIDVQAPVPEPQIQAARPVKTAPKEQIVKNENNPSPNEAGSYPPEPINPAIQGGNAVRLEIFLSGEQMSGMLKAIMAGQHSVLTVREAASYLRVSPRTIEKLVEDGEIPAVEIDGRYRFPKSNLDDWLANQSAEHEEERDVA